MASDRCRYNNNLSDGEADEADEEDSNRRIKTQLLKPPDTKKGKGSLRTFWVVPT